MKVAVITSALTSVLLTVVLKGLSYFNFIKWKPITFIKKSELWKDSATFTHWAILVCLLFVLAFILYVGAQYLYFMPAGFTSFVIGAVLAILIEWKILDLPSELTSFKKLSIPFMVIIIGFSRFIIDTAGYHMRAKNLDNRNKLPYKTGMIK